MKAIRECCKHDPLTLKRRIVNLRTFSENGIHICLCGILTAICRDIYLRRLQLIALHAVTKQDYTILPITCHIL